MKKEQSKSNDLEIKKAPEELTEQDLLKVTGGNPSGGWSKNKDRKCTVDSI